MRGLALAAVIAAAAGASWTPNSLTSTRSSGPKNGKTARHAKQKAAKKSKQQARRMK